MSRDEESKWLEFYRITHNRWKLRTQGMGYIKGHCFMLATLISVTVGAMSLMFTSAVFISLGKIA